MPREQITWHTEPNDSSVFPPPPAIFNSLHSQLILSFTLFFLWWFFYVFLWLSWSSHTYAIVLSRCEMWRRFSCNFRISSESSVWSEFVTSQTRVQNRERERQGEREGDRDKSESRRPTQCAAVSCNSVPATLPTVTARRRTCFNWIRRKLHLNAAACRQLQHVRGKGTGSCVVWKREKGKRAYTAKAGQH